MRVALADDEKELLEQVSAIVVGAGHEVETFLDGSALQRALQRETYDIVLLDWNMPGMTGPEVVSWAAENMDTPPPFIVMTSRAAKEDVVHGLEAGAVDYIIKPESDEVIKARMEAAARRNETSKPDTHASYGKYSLDRKAKAITVDGEDVPVTSREFDLIDLFFQNFDRPLSRGYLLSKVWGGNADLETRTVDVHISRLRAKLKLEPANGFVISTVFGFGYRMDAYNDEPSDEG